MSSAPKQLDFGWRYLQARQLDFGWSYPPGCNSVPADDEPDDDLEDDSFLFEEETEDEPPY